MKTSKVRQKIHNEIWNFHFRLFYFLEKKLLTSVINEKF